jgi:hypothetical protein
MKKSFLVLVTSALLITLFPGAANAAPGDTTIYPITCVSSGRVNVYLDYGINSITITNPNACHSAESLYISDGTGATWTYSQTIGGTTTSGSYDPAARPNFETGAIGSADSFTLTLASTSNSSLTVSNGYRTLDIFFNNQFNTLSPNPVAIGQQVTVTGSNLSSVTSLFLQSSSNYFSATTSNRTSTQLTFTVPLTVVDFMSGVTSDVIPGVYSLNSARGKTLTVIAAPVVVSVSAEEVARLAAVAATAQREADKSSARAVILTKFRSYEKISVAIFAQAEINGITAQNIEAVQAEIDALPKESRGDITQILKIARKFEIVGMIASDRVTSVYSDSLIEIGLIAAGSKHKAALTAAIKKLPASERSSYEAIKAAIDAELADIQARNNRSKTILSRIVSHRTY